MTDYRCDFKARRFGFGNIEEIRALRADTADEKRKDRRTRGFAKHRNLDIETASPLKKKTEKCVDSRSERLLRWRKERELRNKLKKQQAKPAFKVGITHHKFYSPVYTKPNGKKESPQKPKEIPKRITRATEKRLAAKAAEAAISMQNKKINKKAKKTNVVEKSNTRESFAPEGYKFKPPTGLPKIPLIDKATPIKSNKISNTQWFALDAEDKLEKSNKQSNIAPKNNDSQENNAASRDGSFVRFGRISVHKQKFKNFDIFDFSTPVIKKETNSKVQDKSNNTNDVETKELPKKKSINQSVLMTTSKFTRRSMVIEEKLNEDDEEEHCSPIVKINKTPKRNKTPKVNKINVKHEIAERLSDAKAQKSPHVGRKIKIRRAQFR